MFDDVNMLRWVFACLTMAALLGLFAVLATKYGRGGFTTRVSAGQKTLRVDETLWLDARHKVIKIADGDTRHTVLLAPNGSLLLATTPTKATTKEADPDA
jgi:hypothetical protein